MFLSKGQNVIGFETMVNTLVSGAVDTLSSTGLYEDMQTQNTILLDAREAIEFEVSHLENARNVGYDDFELSRLSDIDPNSSIVIYCSIGKRSEDIALKLKQAGYTDVKNLYGGIFDWTNRGYPVFNASGKQVEQVHPYSTIWGFWVNNYTKRYEP